MTTLIDQQTFSVTLPDGSIVAPTEGHFTLDDGGAPYAVASIVIPAPTNITQLDPRSQPSGAQPPRVLLNMTAEYADMAHVSDLTTLFGAGTVANLTTLFGAGTVANLTTLFGASTVWQALPTTSRNADLAVTDFRMSDDGSIATLELACDEAYALDAEAVQLATWGAAGVKSLVSLVGRALAVEMPLQFSPSVDYDLTAAIAASPAQVGYSENLLPGLQTYVDLAGARLWCDESRVWHLDQNIAPLALTAIYTEGFEGGGVSGWTDPTSTLTNSTTRAKKGTHSLKQANAGSTGGLMSRTFTGLTIGASYTFSAWFWRAGGSDIDYVWVGNRGTLSTNPLPPAAKWTQLSVTFTALTTSEVVSCYVDWLSPTAGAYWDEFLLTTPTIIPVASTTLRAGQSVTAYTDALSRDSSSSWANLVKIIYSWITSGGVPMQQIDRADGRVPGVPGKQLVISKDKTPYPGAGAAAATLARTQSYGHEIAISAINDFTITPRQNVVASLPTGDFTGTVSAVTWDIESGDMTITSRNLT